MALPLRSLLEADERNPKLLSSYLHYAKSGIAQQIIHAIKYNGQQQVGETMGRWFGEALRSQNVLPSHFDYLTSVPLHPARLRQRGYNQSDCLVRGLSETTGLPVRDVLQRNHFKESQTRKGRADRFQNVATTFSVRTDVNISGHHILLVDDVTTTGATLNACADALEQASCASVRFLTLAATR